MRPCRATGKWRGYATLHEHVYFKRVTTRRGISYAVSSAIALVGSSVVVPMPAFQNPAALGSNKRKHDEHDPNYGNRKRPAVTDDSGVSGMEGDHYWMVQW